MTNHILSLCYLLYEGREVCPRSNSHNGKKDWKYEFLKETSKYLYCMYAIQCGY